MLYVPQFKEDNANGRRSELNRDNKLILVSAVRSAKTSVAGR